jgi:23S rRNA pseudouridine955/2504/2580 synthase
MIELTARKDDNGRRLDRILRKALPDLSLSLIHRLLRQKKVLVDNKPVILPNYRIEQGMVIKIIASVNHNNKQINHNFVNQKKFEVNNNSAIDPSLHSSLLTIPILWQGSGIIVFNKPQGLSTHGPNSLDSMVYNWLAEEGALPRSLSFKPGPLHRLDKPTSGAIVFSQTLEGAKLFSALLRKHNLEKTYMAIVEGSIEGENIWRDSLEHDKNAHKTFVKNKQQGRKATPPDPTLKEAVTTVKTLVSNGEYSLIEARIKTGRHHQIRAQAASHGHPLAGDIKYGASPLPGQSHSGEFFLHAWKIKFIECPDGFPQEITAPLPEMFQLRIEALFKS